MATDAHALTTAEHSPVGGLAHDASGGISNPVLGMLLFITSEVMNRIIPRIGLLIPPRA